MPDRAEDLLKSHQQLQTERANFDSLNQQIADYVEPEQGQFNTKDRQQGDDLKRRQYDNTATTEAQRHAAAIDSLATPAGQKWDGLAPLDPKLAERDDVLQYFDDVLDVLRAERASSNFQEQMFDVWRLGGIFGTAPLLIEDKPGGGLTYRCLPTAECYLDIAADTSVSRLDRRYKLTAKAAFDKFNDACPEAIKNALPNDPLKKFEFLHVIMKNPERQAGYLDARGMPWVGIEIAVDAKKTLTSGGFHCFPAPVYRYALAPNEWYGRGWCAQVLPTIKQVNRMARTMDRQAEKAADPPLLAFDDGLFGYGDDGSGNVPSLGAGDIHWGGVTSDGKPLVMPLHTLYDAEKGLERLKARQGEIKDAALTSVFQIFADRERMTATEWLGIMNEKAQLTVPVVGRAAIRFLMQVNEREIDILDRQGKLPPMPRALIAAGGKYQIRFNSPLMRLMQMSSVTAGQTWIGQIAPFFQIKPELADIPEWETMMRESGQILGVPAKWIKDKDALAAIAAQRAKAAQAQQMLAAAPGLAGAVKDVAQAGQIARS